MTTSIANLRDLEIKRNSANEPVYFLFGLGFCDDFAETVEALKAEIPPTDRAYDGTRKRWMVKISKVNETRLARLFHNWTEQLDAARLQAGLFL